MMMSEGGSDSSQIVGVATSPPGTGGVDATARALGCGPHSVPCFACLELHLLFPAHGLAPGRRDEGY